MYSPLPQYVREQHRKYRMQKVRNAGKLLALTAAIFATVAFGVFA